MKMENQSKEHYKAKPVIVTASEHEEGSPRGKKGVYTTDSVGNCTVRDRQKNNYLNQNVYATLMKHLVLF